MNFTEYLNVDLEINSTIDLTPISEYFGDRVLILFNGQVENSFRLVLETQSALLPEARDRSFDADACIKDFLALIEELPASLRQAWDASHSRVFDIGISGGTGPRMFLQTVSEHTIRAVSDVGGSIRVTVYPRVH